MVAKNNIFHFKNRKQWRHWLEINFEQEKEIWFVFTKKNTGKPSISYNDAVEEALCFGWIDSIVKTLDDNHRMQRFTPRNPKSSFSQLNIERLKWLLSNNLVHPSLINEVNEIVSKEYIFPPDIIQQIKNDHKAWENYKTFSDSYKRIRIAYIDGARKRPEEFKKRLEHFITKTRDNKKIISYGGSEKYY